MEQYIADQVNKKYPDAAVSVNVISPGHFEVHVASSEFAGMSMLGQQRSIMDLFKEDLSSERIHALALKTTVR